MCRFLSSSPSSLFPLSPNFLSHMVWLYGYEIGYTPNCFASGVIGEERERRGEPSSMSPLRRQLIRSRRDCCRCCLSRCLCSSSSPSGSLLVCVGSSSCLRWFTVIASIIVVYIGVVVVFLVIRCLVFWLEYHMSIISYIISYDITCPNQGVAVVVTMPLVTTSVKRPPPFWF